MKNLKILIALSSIQRGNEAVNLSARIDFNRIMLAAEFDYIYSLKDPTKVIHPNGINFGSNLKVAYNYLEIEDTEMFGDLSYYFGFRLNHSSHNMIHRDRDANGTQHFVNYHKRFKKVTPMGFVQGEANWDGFIIGVEMAMGQYHIYDLNYSTSSVPWGLEQGTFLNFTTENVAHYFQEERNQIVMQINVSLGYEF